MAVGSGIQRQWNAFVAYELQSNLNVPASGLGANLLPLTAGRGNLTMDAIPSLQVRQDGMTVRGRHGTHKTKGDYKGELQAANYDPIFEAVMRGTWQIGASTSFPGGDLLVNPAAGALVRRYWTVEEHEFDINSSEVYPDCVWTMFDLTMKPNGMIDCNTGWIGTGAINTIQNAPSNFTTPAYPLNNVVPMAALDATLSTSNLGTIADLTAWNLKVDLAAVAPPVAASQFSPDVFDGVMKISGTMTIMRQNLQPLTDAIAETSISMSATMITPGGNQKLKITIPFMTWQNAEKSEFKRDGGPLTVTIPFPEAMIGVDTTGGANPATMVILERLYT